MSVNIDRLTEGEQLHITSCDSMGLSTAGEGCINEVAADTNAVKACMAAWIERLMREEGVTWEKAYYRVMIEAKEIAFAAILKGTGRP
jgi:hypothetical protein